MNGVVRDMVIAETYLNFANKKAAEKIIDLILSGKT